MKTVFEKSWNMKILFTVMEFYQFYPQNAPNFNVFFASTKKLSIYVESLHFPTFSGKNAGNAKLQRELVMEKLTNGHGKVIENS